MTSKTWRSVSKYQKISSIDNIQKGDIIVFRMSSSKGHVGIAMSGSEMVDASSGEGCVVRRKDYEILCRDELFQKLSMNVDDVFLMLDAETAKVDYVSRCFCLHPVYQAACVY